MGFMMIGGEVSFTPTDSCLGGVWAKWAGVAKFQVDQTNKDINQTQKAIGLKRKAKENADELMVKKKELENGKKELEVTAAAKEEVLRTKLIKIGNLVHESVPVSDNEVGDIMGHEMWDLAGGWSKRGGG